MAFNSFSPPSSSCPLTVVSLLLTAFLLASVSPFVHASPSDPDFIIVGAGTSGCVLAARLCSRLPHARILLLERGRPRTTSPPSRSELNVRAARLVFDAWLDKDISSISYTEWAGRPLPIISGHTLGGSSAINAGQFTIPPNGTFKSWGISKLSDARAQLLLRDRVLPRVRPTAVSDPVTDIWLNAMTKDDRIRRAPDALDSWADTSAAFVSLAAFDSSGRRRDSCTAYQPHLACGNRLTVLSSARVDRVLFKDNTGKLSLDSKREKPKITAYGVQVTFSELAELNGIRYSPMEQVQLRARHEIILSAGPYESPRLLQISGVGPHEVLRNAGVDQILELPVGIYAQARAACGVSTTYILPEGAVYRANDQRMANAYNWLRARKSLFSGCGGPLSWRIGGGNGRLANLAELTMSSAFPLSSAFPGPSLLGMHVLRTTCVLNPDPDTYSPIAIVSNNSSVAPKLIFNALGPWKERVKMVTCLKQVRELQRRIKGSNVKDMSDTELHEYVRTASQSSQHFVAANAVGKVVDEELKLKHANNIRVVDASVIPAIPESAGPMASVYIIAEHAADLIADEYAGVFADENVPSGKVDWSGLSY